MKVSKDKDDEYKHFDDETYDRDVVDNYLQVSLYNDSPEFKPIRKNYIMTKRWKKQNIIIILVIGVGVIIS